MIILIYAISLTIFGDIVRYIAYAILLKCENLCDIDIAHPNIAYIAILPNPNGIHTMQLQCVGIASVLFHEASLLIAVTT